MSSNSTRPRAGADRESATAQFLLLGDHAVISIAIGYITLNFMRRYFNDADTD